MAPALTGASPRKSILPPRMAGRGFGPGSQELESSIGQVVVARHVAEGFVVCEVVEGPNSASERFEVEIVQALPLVGDSASVA
eukprot:1309352-Lingulodinium_polyedra.AAC.1